MAESFKCGLILLAAGASRRMGRPKQLLPVAGRPLLRHAAESAAAAPVAPVVVVLGARAAEIAPCLDGLPVQIVVNAQWDQGMGSSVRTGLRALTAGTPGLATVIIALADQPGCPADHFARLIETHRATGRSIVASSVAGVPGPPVLFTAVWFHLLLVLDGDTGARRLLRAQRAHVATVPLASGTDLDTPADYERYLRTAEGGQPLTQRKSR